MTQAELGTKTRPKTRRPRQFNVVMLNDDFTTFEFVMAVMVRIFKLSESEAQTRVMDIHKKGKGLVGPFTCEIAETRAALAMQWAQKYDFPFKCSVEPA